MRAILFAVSAAAVAAAPCGAALLAHTCEPNSDCKHTKGCQVLGSSTAATTVETCCALCAETDGCAVWTLNGGTQTCWLRTGTSRQNHGNCTTGTMPPTPPTPVPPTPPPTPVPPTPPTPPSLLRFEAAPTDLGHVLGASTGDDAQSFYALPCAPSAARSPSGGPQRAAHGEEAEEATCVFGKVGDRKNTAMWSAGAGWHRAANASAPTFLAPTADASALRSLGNLSQQAFSPAASAFEGDGGQSLVTMVGAPPALCVANETPPARMRYSGLPCAAYKHRIGSGGTVKLRGGALLLQTVNFKCANDSNSPGHSTLGLYRSVDGGQLWAYASTVASWHDTVGPDGKPEDEGPNENDLVVLPGGGEQLLVVVRADSGDGVPRKLLRGYFTVKSADGGQTWGEPSPLIASNGVAAGSARPRLLLMGGEGGGPLLLAGGRPGLYMWVNAAADGERWDAVNLAAAHNDALRAANASASLRFCDAFVRDSLAHADTRTGVVKLSMSYNSLVATSRCTGMVMYGRAKFADAGFPSCAAAESTVFALPFALRTPACP